AHALRGLTDYVVGAQDAIAGDGFEYDQALAVLASNPGSVTTADLADSLVSSFARRYGSTGQNDILAAVRTEGMNALAEALHTFSTAVRQGSVADRQRLSVLAAESQIPNDWLTLQRDLGSFL